MIGIQCQPRIVEESQSELGDGDKVGEQEGSKGGGGE